MSNLFRIQVASDIDYHDLIAEVYCGDEFVALLSQEKGYAELGIEIQPRRDGTPWSFKCSEFVSAIEKAKGRLWDLRKSQP
jgi:hypothetical protein